MLTGRAGRGVAGAVALAAGLWIASPPEAHSQALKLETLRFPPTSVVGPWVSYRVRTQTRSRPIREYTQRVAIVSRESHHGQEGFWVELKTEGLSGTRIERGFFVLPEPVFEGEAAKQGIPVLTPRAPTAHLTRYQVLTPGGKLYEYPVERAHETRAGGDISTVELFEYNAEIAPVFEDLGPDTLRIGRRVVPTVAERIRRAGADAWHADDTLYVNRPLLIQTYWKNPAVPITGLARSLFQVTMERIPASARDTMPIAAVSPGTESGSPTPADSGAAAGAPADSGAAAGAPGDSGTAAAARPDSRAIPRAAAIPILSWTEVILKDLGADAVPEVTQKPEAPAPESPTPGTIR